MDDKSNIQGSPLLYLALYWILYGICVVAWMPAPSSFGSSAIGVSTALVAISVPLLFFAPPQVLLDDGAVRYGYFLFWCMALLMFWGFLASFNADQILRTGRFFLSIGQGFVLVTMIASIVKGEQIVVVFRIMVAMMFLSVSLSILAKFNAPLSDLIYADTDRAHGLFKNSNQFGMILSMCLPSSMLFLIIGRAKLVPFVALLMILAGLAMAGSKTNLVIAGLLLFLSLTYGLVTVKRYFLLLFMLPATMILAIYATLPLLETINPRAAKILGNVSDPSASNTRSVYQRVELWNYSLNVMAEKPLLGEGTAQRIITPRQNLSHSHNVFLDAGRTLGIPGFVGMIWLLGTSVLFALFTLYAIAPTMPSTDQQRFNKALLASACFGVLSSVLSNQMSDSFGPSTSPFFWICAGLMLRRNSLMK